MNYVRQFSAAGPCIVQGEVTSETDKFYVFTCKYTGKTRKLAKGWKNHIEPCPSCRDHAHTQYPNGYMD